MSGTGPAGTGPASTAARERAARAGSTGAGSTSDGTVRADRPRDLRPRASRPVFFAWDGEQVDYSDAMLTRGRSYGSYVNTARALPDVRDGLKPVQRRIIVAMDDLGLRSDRKYSKSAKTVGHVIGTYHPHGDTAVYDAMVRMAQPGQSNLPLIDGQGNWGNLHNEAPAAAQRYTECRLSPPSTEFLTDLRPEVVAYEANFDETRQMPRVLPVTFPNLLVNGSMGVGWAMACSVPPHNTAEVISAALLSSTTPTSPSTGSSSDAGTRPPRRRDHRQPREPGIYLRDRPGHSHGPGPDRATAGPAGPQDHRAALSGVGQVHRRASRAGAKAGKITQIYTAELPQEPDGRRRRGRTDEM